MKVLMVFIIAVACLTVVEPKPGKIEKPDPRRGQQHRSRERGDRSQSNENPGNDPRFSPQELAFLLVEMDWRHALTDAANTLHVQQSLSRLLARHIPQIDADEVAKQIVQGDDSERIAKATTPRETIIALTSAMEKEMGNAAFEDALRGAVASGLHESVDEALAKMVTSNSPVDKSLMRAHSSALSLPVTSNREGQAPKVRNTFSRIASKFFGSQNEPVYPPLSHSTRHYDGPRPNRDEIEEGKAAAQAALASLTSKNAEEFEEDEEDEDEDGSDGMVSAEVVDDLSQVLVVGSGDGALVTSSLPSDTTMPPAL